MAIKTKTLKCGKCVDGIIKVEIEKKQFSTDSTLHQCTNCEHQYQFDDLKKLKQFKP